MELETNDFTACIVSKAHNRPALPRGRDRQVDIEEPVQSDSWSHMAITTPTQHDSDLSQRNTIGPNFRISSYQRANEQILMLTPDAEDLWCTGSGYVGE